MPPFVLACLLLAPAPAVPVDATSAILDAFRDHPLVAIGDAHGDQQGEAFQLALIRDPRFAKTVNDIVIEMGNSRGQAIVDRYVQGEGVPREALRQVWLDSSQPQAVWLEVPAIVTVVREVNATLPADRRLRVLIGEPPIDWARVQTGEDWRAWMAAPSSDRDQFAMDLIQREVLARHRRALMLYGAGHFFRQPAHKSLVTLLEGAQVKVFSIWTNVAAELSTLQPNVASWPVPSLTMLRGTTLGHVGMATYLGPNAGELSPEWLKPLEEQFDALLYLGSLSSITLARPPKWPCAEPALPEHLRRLALLSQAMADRVKQTCTP